MLVPVGVVLGATALDSDDAGGKGRELAAAAARPFVAQAQAQPEPELESVGSSLDRYPIVLVKGRTLLYDGPEGKAKIRIEGKTEWDSARWLSVVRRRGGWLAVLVPELKNGKLGWIHEDEVAKTGTVAWALRADLSRRELRVERNGRVVRRVQVGVGRVDHPTPTGRYAVTDKLKVTDPASPYGCCALALTGHQTKLPAGWPGGDRLAVHATADLTGLGQAVSLGCLRSAPEDAQWLIDHMPIGTPVFIRP